MLFIRRAHEKIFGNFDEVQQKQMQSPTPGRKPPQAPVHAGGRSAGKQPDTKPGGHQVDHELVMCPYCR